LGADDSNGGFSITPAGTVLTPNGGEPLTGLSSTTISWVPHPDTARHTIRFSLDEGASWTNLVSQDATFGASYNWLVPNDISSSAGFVRVAPYTGTSQWLGKDVSNSFFILEAS
jgi:hypothetical protein